MLLKSGCRHKEQDLMNLEGAMYSAILFLGATNISAVQPVVAVERTVFYREKAAGMYSALPYAFAQVNEPEHFTHKKEQNKNYSLVNSNN